MTYGKLLDDAIDTENGGGLESQHRLIALFGQERWKLAPKNSKIERRHPALDEGLAGFAHIERGKALAVSVELVIVILNELLC